MYRVYWIGEGYCIHDAYFDTREKANSFIYRMITKGMHRTIFQIQQGFDDEWAPCSIIFILYYCPYSADKKYEEKRCFVEANSYVEARKNFLKNNPHVEIIRFQIS